MVEKLSTKEDLNEFIKERKLSMRMREAVGFCKQTLEITTISDRPLKYEERVNFERCLVDNYLTKFGQDYFGKRDLIYIDLYSMDDLKRLQS